MSPPKGSRDIICLQKLLTTPENNKGDTRGVRVRVFNATFNNISVISWERQENCRRFIMVYSWIYI
jgi:hypothetical protein